VAKPPNWTDSRQTYNFLINIDHHLSTASFFFFFLFFFSFSFQFFYDTNNFLPNSISRACALALVVLRWDTELATALVTLKRLLVAKLRAMDSRGFPELGYYPQKRVRDTPRFTVHHPMIPQRYVPPWQLDMKNRKQIILVSVCSGQ